MMVLLFLACLLKQWRDHNCWPDSDNNTNWNTLFDLIWWLMTLMIQVNVMMCVDDGINWRRWLLTCWVVFDWHSSMILMMILLLLIFNSDVVVLLLLYYYLTPNPDIYSDDDCIPKYSDDIAVILCITDYYYWWWYSRLFTIPNYCDDVGRKWWHYSLLLLFALHSLQYYSVVVDDDMLCVLLLFCSQFPTWLMIFYSACPIDILRMWGIAAAYMTGVWPARP